MLKLHQKDLMDTIYTVNIEVITTADGSPTLLNGDIQEHYHSIHGAIQESNHVYISHGYLALNPKADVAILEIGFGTGLNALLTYFSRPEGQTIHYSTLEPFPLPNGIVAMLRSQLKFDSNTLVFFDKLHSVDWNQNVEVQSDFFLHKIPRKIQDVLLEPDTFDLIYFDAFSPRSQSELWTDEIFRKLFDSLKVGGILVTYCAKGSVKRTLNSCGFSVETLPGPPGKREMIRALKRSK